MTSRTRRRAAFLADMHDVDRDHVELAMRAVLRLFADGRLSYRPRVERLVWDVEGRAKHLLELRVLLPWRGFLMNFPESRDVNAKVREAAKKARGTL